MSEHSHWIVLTVVVHGRGKPENFHAFFRPGEIIGVMAGDGSVGSRLLIGGQWTQVVENPEEIVGFIKSAGFP